MRTSSCISSTRMGMPLTTTWRTPLGCSAVSRSPPAGKSRSRLVGPGPTRRLRDFPAGGERLTAEQPSGVRHVLVNGVAIRLDEVQLDVLTQPPGTRPEMG